MKISVHESGPRSALVSVDGNPSLTLYRSETKYDGCTIALSHVFKIIKFAANTWQSESNLSYEGGFEVDVIDGSGQPIFATRGEGRLTPIIDRAEAPTAAAAMWAAAPNGRIVVRGGDSRFPGEASLAGFRELWKWGVNNCGFPALDGTP